MENSIMINEVVMKIDRVEQANELIKNSMGCFRFYCLCATSDNGETSLFVDGQHKMQIAVPCIFNLSDLTPG